MKCKEIHWQEKLKISCQSKRKSRFHRTLVRFRSAERATRQEYSARTYMFFFFSFFCFFHSPALQLFLSFTINQPHREHLSGTTGQSRTSRERTRKVYPCLQNNRTLETDVPSALSGSVGAAVEVRRFFEPPPRVRTSRGGISSKRRVPSEAEEHRWGTVSKSFFNVAIGGASRGAAKRAAAARDRSLRSGIRKKLQDAYPMVGG